MKPTSLHLLFTYQCTLECEHCFVWGSPRQTGTLTLAQVEVILRQALALGHVTSIYFEGGEPFLYHGALLAAVREAHRLGFEVGIVSNGYWATGPEDALEVLRPFAGLVQDLSISSDHYHWGQPLSAQAQHIYDAANHLGVPVRLLSISQPGATPGPNEVAVMYRGRAAQTLAARAAQQPWQSFGSCSHEDLRTPERVHIDPLGNVFLCQGLVLGNLFEVPLRTLCAEYEPEAHPIVGPLLAGGPAELARRYDVPHAAAYADACHLCDEARRRLRRRFPRALGPDQMYAVPEPDYVEAV